MVTAVSDPRQSATEQEIIIINQNGEELLVMTSSDVGTDQLGDHYILQYVTEQSSVQSLGDIQSLEVGDAGMRGERQPIVIDIGGVESVVFEGHK